MGIGVAANGDVWIADSEGDQLLFFPGGRVKEGRIVKVAGLAGPFDVVIDEQNRVWVSNSRSDTVVRFPANDPTKVETFRVGVAPRALALDSKSNVWVVSFLSPDFPGLKPLPPNATIMQEFQAFSDILAGLQSGRVKSTGFVSMIRPDGTQPSPRGYSGDGAVNVPWGINVDGNDDVWTTNGWTPGSCTWPATTRRGIRPAPRPGTFCICSPAAPSRLHGRIHRRRGQCLVHQQLE